MRQLLPTPLDDVDPYDVYRPEDPFAPLLRLNMVASVDGEATDRHGRSGELGGEGDLHLLRTLRALADAIIVGAGTVRVERYGPHRLRGRLAERRAAEGRDAPAPIVVVSRSLEVDLAGPLFTEVETPTIVLTCDAAPQHRRRQVADAGGRLLVAGDEFADLEKGVGALRSELGLQHLLCEGGPRLNQQLFTAGLVDELCLTISPQLIAREGLRIVAGLPVPISLQLSGVCEQDRELYLRYRVVR